MTQLPLQLPQQLIRLSEDVNRERHAVQAGSAQLSGLGLQELMERIKSQEALKQQGLVNRGGINTALAGQGVITDTASRNAGIPASPTNALDRLRGSALLAKDSSSGLALGKLGFGPDPLEGVVNAGDIVGPETPTRPITPLLEAQARAGNTANVTDTNKTTVDVLKDSRGNIIGLPKVRTEVTRKVNQPGLPDKLPTTKGPNAPAPKLSADQKSKQAEAVQAMIDAGVSKERIQKTLDKIPPEQFLAGFNPQEGITVLNVGKLDNQGDF